MECRTHDPNDPVDACFMARECPPGYIEIDEGVYREKQPSSREATIKSIS